MKVCVTSEEKSLSSPVSSRFGRSRYFFFFDIENEKDFSMVENSAVSYGRGAGVSAAQQMADEKVSAVITGRVGPNAYNALLSFGVKMYDGAGNSIKEAVKMLKENKLTPIKEAQFGPGNFVNRRNG